MLNRFPLNYTAFVRLELEKLLVKDSFAYLLKRQIGLNLHGVASDTYFGDAELPKEFSALQLFEYLRGGWLFDLEWLRNDEGIFISDSREPIPDDLNVSLSPVEHLACYGLWLISVEYWAVGIDEDDWKFHGFEKVDAIAHQAECVLLASQSLVFAQKFIIGEPLSKEDQERLVRAALALRAAEAKHSMPGGSREKRRTIQNIWMSGKYSSRDICAEQECAALGMSFSSARKALRGTPDPA